MIPELQAFLDEIDRGLSGAREMHLLGGGALLAAYQATLAAPVLDVPAEEAPAWALAGSPLERKHGLCLNPIAAAGMPSDWRARCLEVKRLPRLRVLAPSKEDLLLSKLGRFSDTDRADVSFLAGLSIDRLALISRYRLLRRQHRGDLRPLDRSFNYVLKEHFSLGPFRF